MKSPEGSASGAATYEFGPFSLEVATARLLKGDEPVALPPKTFDTLLVLVRGEGALVDKGELMRQLWPGTFVEESNLAQQVFTLRRILGAQADGRPYIETVPKRGYRFAAPLRIRRPSDAVSLAAAAPEVAMASPERSTRGREVPAIAVLPFRELTGDAGEHLGLGIADALITRLSTVRSLAVRPTGSIVQYAKNDDPLAAARALGAVFVVDGKIQRAGDRIRVTTQLLRVANGEALWGATFDEPYTSIFAVEDAIAERVAAALIPSLTTADRSRLTRGQTRSPDAYRNYVLGRYHWARRTDQDLATSVTYFERATAIDPQYALAYAGLADAYNILGNFSALPPRDAYPHAQTAARRALAIDPELAEAQVALVFASFLYERTWADAERGFHRALELNPFYPPGHQWFGVYLSSAGRMDEAVAELRRAVELDPPSLVLNSVLAWVLYAARRYDEAIAQCDQTLRMEPSFALAHVYKAQALVQTRDVAAAIAGFRRAAGGAEPASPRVLSELAHALATGGDIEQATALRHELEARSARDYVDPFGIALIELALGDRDGALTMLERAEQERYPWLVRMGVEPRLDPLRGEPRFQAIARRVGVPGS